jgi:uncharacterized protein
MSAPAARLARLCAVALLVAGSAGCARLFGTYDLAPNGLASSEDRLRSQLASGQAAAAFSAFGKAYRPPDDEVLRALYQGVLAYYAGAYDESARVLDIAADLADDRITKSISRSALSVISNDLILPYEPGRTERLMIPFYAALARSGLGDREGAAVEARRLSLLLQRYADVDRPLDSRLAATLRYVAGAIFEANGDRNDADIAYRNAHALDSTLIVPQRSTANDAGTVVVVLEQGFVAHRVEQGLAVMLAPEEMDLIANGDGDEKGAALSFVAARTLQYAAHGPSWLSGGAFRPTTLYVPEPADRSSLPRRRPKVVCRPVDAEEVRADSARPTPPRHGTKGNTEPECRAEEHEIDELPYLLKVAWPVYYRDTRTPHGARLLTGTDTLPFHTAADVSRGVLDDFEGERSLIIARTVARGAAKLALTKGAEKSIEEKNEAAGRIVGLIANLGNVLLERADTRSWHLLPGGIAVLRLELPPGEHQLTAEVGATSVPRTVTLPTVSVRPGGVSLVAVRVW